MLQGKTIELTVLCLGGLLARMRYVVVFRQFWASWPLFGEMPLKVAKDQQSENEEMISHGFEAVLPIYREVLYFYILWEREEV